MQSWCCGLITGTWIELVFVYLLWTFFLVFTIHNEKPSGFYGHLGKGEIVTGGALIIRRIYSYNWELPFRSFICQTGNGSCVCLISMFQQPVVVTVDMKSMTTVWVATLIKKKLVKRVHYTRLFLLLLWEVPISLYSYASDRWWING